jgi:ketosteroid isomerase-like protein
MTRAPLVAAMFSILFGASSIAAQQSALQPKTPVERPLSPKDARHEFVVTGKGNQAFSVTVQQQGIDVVVTVLGPDGKQLVEVDNASAENGIGGSEIAHVIALAAGTYHVRVTPFERPDAKPAKYTITLSEMRDLTAAERANAESEREIAQIEEQWEQAHDKGMDVATLTRILRDDGFHLGPTAGATTTREQMLASWETEAKRRAKLGVIREHGITEHVIKAAGNTAVSTGRFVITDSGKDRDATRFSGQFVHIWGKDQSGWKLVGDYTFPFGRVVRKTEPVKVDPTVFAAYAGTYRDEGGANTIMFTVDNGALQAQFRNATDTSPKFPMKALSDTTFAGVNPGDEITFVRSSNGEVNECILIGDGPAVRQFRVK